MKKEKQNIADVEFIFREAERFALMPPPNLIRHLRENRVDTFAVLNRPAGGILFCGRAVYNRFYEIANRTIKHGSMEAKKFGRRDYVRALRATFIELFIEGGKKINKSSVLKLVNRAKLLSSEGLIHVTHHIPCVLFYEKEPATFTAGPVTFRRTDKFLADYNHAVEAYHESNLKAFANALHQRRPDLSEGEILLKATCFADTHIGMIRDYYREYDWVASVTIALCHPALSKSRAECVVDAALNVLCLFVQSYTERYCRANAPDAPFETCELVSIKNKFAML